MNILEKFIVATSGEFAETPKPYGWFHLLCLGLMVIAIVAECIWGRRLSDKGVRVVLLLVAISLILFEVYKQLQFSYDISSGKWEYTWYYFPFQFCSVPMYVMLLAGLTKGKFQEYLCSFLATFAVIGGVITMFYPATVFIGTIGICIQTMYWHGVLLVMGVLMWVSGKVKFEHKTLLKGASVFVVVVLLALGMNALFHYLGDIEKYSFNMFYISPYENSGLPVLGQLWDALPYALYLPLYIIGFSAGAYIVVLLAMLIAKIASSRKTTYKY